jgi:glycosyltransferase involved in cell wall biosynthesis
MKIGFFLFSFNIGGIERWTVTLANELAKYHHVSIAVCKNSGVLRNSLSDKIKVYDLGNIRAWQSPFPLVKYLKTERPDILISSGERCNVIALTVRYISRTSIKNIIVQHNHWNLKALRAFGIFTEFVIALFYGKANAIVAVSHGVENSLRMIKLLDTRRIFCILNPLNFKEMIRKSKEGSNRFGGYLLYVGRFEAIKNIPLIIRAFRMLLDAYKPEGLRLLLAGSGKEEYVIRQLCTDYNLHDRCVFLGNVDCIENLIQNAKVVLLASFSEAMPFTVLETLALNKYIVSTPAQGCMEIFQIIDYPYFTSGFHDEKEYCDLIYKVMYQPDNPEYTIKLKRIFDISEIVTQWNELFNRVKETN